MAPLQLRLEPNEVVSATDKGAARVSASTAPTRAHYRYDYAPARYPGARPEPAQREGEDKVLRLVVDALVVMRRRWVGVDVRFLRRGWL
eukprot:scaffold2448_cov119-Isochrysis_galbana.AAC.6